MPQFNSDLIVERYTFLQSETLFAACPIWMKIHTVYHTFPCQVENGALGVSPSLYISWHPTVPNNEWAKDFPGCLGGEGVLTFTIPMYLWRQWNGRFSGSSTLYRKKRNRLLLLVTLSAITWFISSKHQTCRRLQERKWLKFPWSD